MAAWEKPPFPGLESPSIARSEALQARHSGLLGADHRALLGNRVQSRAGFVFLTKEKERRGAPSD
jgi:hypothetical protein